MADLKRLTIKGFKTIASLENFELGRINLLIGENGAGKSNFVSFFRFLSFMCNGELQRFVNTHGFGSAFVLDGPAVTSRIQAELCFDAEQGTNEYAFQLAHGAPDTLIFMEERYRYSNRNYPQLAKWSTFDAGHRESALIQEAEGGNSTARFIRGCLRRCIVHQFHNTSETARVRLAWDKDDNRYLKEDGANLAAVLLRLRDQAAPYYRRIVENIRTVTPLFLDFELESSNGKVLLQWRERATDMVFGPHQASDGTLRIMALFTLLLQPEESLPDVIIMDEPELGLHPYAIGVVAGLIKSVSQHTQVILATQSVNLLNYFQPEDIVVLDRPQRGTIFKRLNGHELADWLKKYSMAELWEKNVLGGTP